jgi:hypothetical protein
VRRIGYLEKRECSGICGSWVFSLEDGCPQRGKVEKEEEKKRFLHKQGSDPVFFLILSRLTFQYLIAIPCNPSGCLAVFGTEL